MKTIAEIGLLILEKIRGLLGKKVRYQINDGNSLTPNHTIWDALLKKNVREDGLVDYKAFIKDQDRLKEYTKTLSNNPPATSWTNNEQLVYWINAYNAFTIALVVKHYPVKSIKDIAGNIPMINSVWDLKFFKIGGIDFDLSTIEHEILRKKFDEPRIHFAINCASISCPKLRREAYTASRVDNQLEEQAVIFITSPNYNKITPNHVYLSKIFEWFKTDFTRNQDILQFLSQYTRVTFDDKVIFEYFPYNWNLNELKKKK